MRVLGSFYREEEGPPMMEEIPEQFRGFQWLVFRGKRSGNRFFSSGYSEDRKDYRSDMYIILAGFNTMWECQQFLGFNPRYWARDEKGELK